MTLFFIALRRALREARRLLLVVVAVPLVVPVFVLAVFSRVFEAVVRIPNFEGGSTYVQYIAPAALLMAVMLSFTGATSVAVERQNGFYDRMRISPRGVGASNTARRIADAVKVALFALVLIFVSRLSGAEIESWVAVLTTGVVLSALWGLAYGGLAFAISLRLARPEAAEAVLPLFFPLLFMSSAFLPLVLLPGWMQPIARYNPLTYLADAIRSAYTGSVDMSAVGWSLLGIAAVGVVTQLLVHRAEVKAAAA